MLALFRLTIGERKLTPAEEGHVGEVPRLARLALAAQAPVPLRPQEEKLAVSAVGAAQDGSLGVAPALGWTCAYKNGETLWRHICRANP